MYEPRFPGWEENVDFVNSLFLVLYFFPPVMENGRGNSDDGAVTGCGRRMVVMLLVGLLRG